MGPITLEGMNFFKNRIWAVIDGEDIKLENINITEKQIQPDSIDSKIICLRCNVYRNKEDFKKGGICVREICKFCKSETRRRHKKKIRDKGLCVCCGKQSLPDQIHCEICALKSRDRDRDRRAKFNQEEIQNYRNKTRDRKAKLKQESVQYKGGCCVDCGLIPTDVVIMDFHHINSRDKDKGISRLFGTKITTEELHKELDKTILLCANCHCKRHNTDKRLTKRRKLKLEAVKYLGNKCITCGVIADQDNLCIFDCHHKNPLDKLYGISEMINHRMSWEDIKKELDKCELMCRNDHRLTYRDPKVKKQKHGN